MSKRGPALVLALLLLLSACGERKGRETPDPGEVTLYFRTQSESDDPGGAVLGREFRALAPESRGVAELMELLLAGPEGGDGLVSPFPPGTRLSSWRLEDGLVTLDMSEEYGGLSGVDQTLADACIVLTLCQLEPVERVSLTVDGRVRPFRDQVLEPESFLLELKEE